MPTITIYTDGGARGNPGPAGAGAVIFGIDGKIVKKAGKFLGERTNNWAEYEAVIMALETAKRLYGAQKLREYKVEVKMDSELVVKQLNNEYQLREPSLFPQFVKVHNMRIKDFPDISFVHIPREQNREADKMVNEAIDGKA